REYPTLLQLFAQKAPITSVESDSAGRRLLTGSMEDGARIWDASTGTSLDFLPGFPSQWASFSPDGQRIIAPAEKTAQVWDASAGTPIGAAMNHASNIFWTAFSPNGRWVVTASENKTARVWDAATGTPIGAEMRHGD